MRLGNSNSLRQIMNSPSAGAKEAMLQLFCGNLDCNYGPSALQASLVLWLRLVLQLNALIRSPFPSRNA